MTDAKAAEATSTAETLDVEKIAKALRSDTDDKAKKDARAAVRTMTGTWEHLPVRIRSAIRTDVGRFIAAGKGKAAVIEAGYSEITAERALRDLGHRG
ncbi:hypothetical protein JZX87_13940 [Agrobacterium sp. Ap1]|uniref:hypothetical protein n=1 Tax=Agrobacterium sp. Ap1 TaxID=2815337 RepID=UPI001A8E9284|nr:hypothetical protein [Agrobacterium sp. Ap1]MBO0142264.1 hypothetical protein [Agrobacterium sp. Ap1]